MRTFHELDANAPIHPTTLIAAAPANATIKGMFFLQLVERARKAGVEVSSTRYLGFRDYPVKDWIRLLSDTAAAVHPDLPPRAGMRRIGRDAHVTFLASTIGKVVMSIAARDFDAALARLPKAYAVTGSHSTVTVEESEANRAVLLFKNVYDGIDAYHAGVLEGGATHFGRDVRIRAADIRPDGGALELSW
jgi:uncharacterized protein (TIGR02265 family)